MKVVLDSLLNNAIREGIACNSYINSYSKNNSFHKQFYPPSYINDICKNYSCGATMLCIDSEHPIHIECHQLLQDMIIDTRGNPGMLDYYAITALKNRKNLDNIGVTLCVMDLPTRREEVLFNNGLITDDQRIGQFVSHVRGDDIFLQKTQIHTALNIDNLSYDFKKFASQFKHHQGQTIHTSFSWLVWPWKNREKIYEEMHSYIDKNFI